MKYNNKMKSQSCQICLVFLQVCVVSYMYNNILISIINIHRCLDDRPGQSYVTRNVENKITGCLPVSRGMLATIYVNNK